MEKSKLYKRTLEVLSIVGAVLGSSLIAANINCNAIGYVAFFVSNAASAVLLLNSNASRVLLYQTVFFTIVNIVGFVRYFV